MIFAAVRRGAWIDEYWTIWETDPSVPLPSLFWHRMLPDVGHPPLFDLIQWPFAHIIGGSLTLRRLTNLVTCFALLLPTLALTRPALAPNGYRPALLLSVFASPFMILKFGEYRSYFTDACAVLALVLLVREVVVGTEFGERPSGLLMGWLAIVAVVAVNLDYTNAVVSGALLLSSAAGLWLAGRKPLSLTLVTLAASAVLLLLIQLRVASALGNTIPSSQVGLVRGSVALALVVASGALVPLPLMLLPSQRRKGSADAGIGLADARLRFAAILLGAVLVSLAGLLLIELASRALLARHAIAAVPLSAALVVELGTLGSRAQRQAIGFAAAAVAFAIVGTFRASRDRGWETLAPVISEQVRACPETQVIALDPLLLLPKPPSSPQVGMTEATEATYQAVALKWNYRLTSRPWLRGSIALARDCATIVWTEHNFQAPFATDRQIAEAAGLRPTDDQLARARRVSAGPQRALLILPPADQVGTPSARGLDESPFLAHDQSRAPGSGAKEER